MCSLQGVWKGNSGLAKQFVFIILICQSGINGREAFKSEYQSAASI